MSLASRAPRNINQTAMNKHLQQLEALRRHPALQVSPEQRPEIVGKILHHLMRPYFLKRTPEMQGKFGEQQYQAFMQILVDYCLQEYIERSEPRLTIDFIKGLHRQFYMNSPSVPVKAVDGSMTSMVPGEFKTVPVFARRGDGWVATTAMENIAHEMALLLDQLHDEGTPLFQRYLQSMFDLTAMHPFPDSNGKLALLLGDLYLLKQGLHPPYFAKYRWMDKEALYQRAEHYAADPQRDLSGMYPVVLRLYAEADFVLDLPREDATHA